MIKLKFNDVKQQKNAKKCMKTESDILFSEFAPITRDITCSNFRETEKI